MLREATKGQGGGAGLSRAPHPRADAMFDHLYAAVPAALEKQRAALLGDA